MARKKSGRSNSSFSGYRWVSINLSQDDKRKLSALDLGAEFPLQEGLCGLAEDGYKFSLSFDAKNHSYIASITDRSPEGEPTHKTTLTGRGSTPLNAWYALCYKHFYIAKGDWLPFIEGNGNGVSDFG